MGETPKKHKARRAREWKEEKVAQLQQRCIVLIDECAFPIGRIEMCTYIHILFHFLIHFLGVVGACFDRTTSIFTWQCVAIYMQNPASWFAFQLWKLEVSEWETNGAVCDMFCLHVWQKTPNSNVLWRAPKARCKYHCFKHANNGGGLFTFCIWHTKRLKFKEIRTVKRRKSGESLIPMGEY